MSSSPDATTPQPRPNPATSTSTLVSTSWSTREGERPTDAEPLPTETPPAADVANGMPPGSAPEHPAIVETRAPHDDETDADFSLDRDLDLEVPGDCTDALLNTGRFTIQDRLGAGGMGVVYRAHDRERGEVVALKTMRLIDPKALYRFKQEFRTLADLAHPNLVNLYELVVSGDLWYFTMELVDGVDFLAHVRGNAGSTAPEDVEEGGASGGVPPTNSGANVEAQARAGEPARVRRLRAALRQLAEGVVALHDAGKLHRDIKPTNVLVTRRGRIVLLDFGLSADLGPTGRHEDVGEPIVGTVAYMAPEQAMGESVSPACDWYSVGVMLHVALTGRLPFEGRPRVVLSRKLEDEPPPPSTLVTNVPADLDALCSELLRRDPAARPTGRAILARLAGAGAPSVATAPAPASAPSPSPVSIAIRSPAPVPACGSSYAAWSAMPLIGRERHQEVLRAAFRTIRAGRTEVVFVSGRSGSGKSTLLQAFLDEVIAADEAVVLSGRCYERESVPYKALDSVVDALSRYLKALPESRARALLPQDVSLLARIFPVLLRVEAVATAPRPSFETPDQQELRRRSFTALRSLLAAIGRHRPLILAIDDLQWADPENAPLIADLIRPPEAPLLLLLGSYRSEDAETNPFLRALLGDDPTDSTTSWLSLRHQELSVGALSQGDSRALALSLLGRDDAITRAEAHLIARESQGNPFFLDELVKHVQGGGGLAHRHASAGAITLDEVLGTRFGRLPDAARLLLGIVAVSGRPIGQALAIRASGLADAGRAAVGLLRTGRLIRITGPSQHEVIEVYHDRIRETVLARFPADALQDHHRRLAEALEATGHADPEGLAVQFQGAGLRDKAGRYFELAADRAAASLAFFHAARLYRRAIVLQGGGRGEDAAATAAAVAPLNRKLGDALANAGRGGEAAQAYLAATAGASVAGALELKRRATMQLLISGRVDEGLAALRSVLAPLGMALPSGPRASLAWLVLRRARLKLRGLGFRRRDTSQLSAETLTKIDLCWSAATGLSIIDPVCGAEFQARGLLLALRAGELYRVARALTLEAMHVSTAGRGRRREVARLLERAAPLAEEAGHPHALGLIPLTEATAALMCGRWREARSLFDRAEGVFRDRCTGVAWELDTIHNLALWATKHMGDLAEIRARWPVLLQEAQERGDLYAVTTLNTHYSTILRLADDDPDGARRELDAVMGRWSHRGFHVQHSHAFRSHVLIDLYRGDGQAAWERIRRQWGPYRRSLLPRVQILRIEFLELRGRGALAAAATSGRPRPLLRSAERDASRLESEREPWALAFAQLLRAGVAVARHERDRAIAHLSAAVERFDAVDMSLMAIVARRRLGELLGREQGHALINGADESMRSRAIRDPARMTAVYAPGFPEVVEPDAESQISTISS